MADYQVAAQLYTIREFMKTPADMETSLKKVADIGYKAVQTSGHGKIEDSELRVLADKAGLEICATHWGWGSMVDDPEGVAKAHDELGVKYVGLGGLPNEYRNGEGYGKFAKLADEAGANLAKYGKYFIYHNHDFEFERYNGKPGLQILMENTDAKNVGFEIDTHWVQAGGGDPAEWILRAKGRIPVVHFKDYTVADRERRFAEIGEGNLNWPRILDACKEAGVQWYCVEQDTCPGDPFESLAISYRNLVKWGLK